MSGSLLSKARVDSKKYITRGGFHESITMETVDGLITVETTGFASKHWNNFDTDGLPINSKNAHICVDENDLISKSYPVRNQDGEIYLRNHRVRVSDSSNEIKNYLIKEWFPNETLGLIVCILSDYEDV